MSANGGNGDTSRRKRRKSSVTGSVPAPKPPDDAVPLDAQPLDPEPSAEKPRPKPRLTARVDPAGEPPAERPRPLPTRKIPPGAASVPRATGAVRRPSGTVKMPPEPQVHSDVNVMPAAPAPSPEVPRRGKTSRIEKPSAPPPPAEPVAEPAAPDATETPSSDDQFTAVDFNALLAAAAGDGRTRDGKNTPIGLDELPGEALETFVEADRPRKITSREIAAIPVPQKRGVAPSGRRVSAALVTALVLAIAATGAGAAFVAPAADARLAATRTVQFRAVSPGDSPVASPGEGGAQGIYLPRTVLGAVSERASQIADHLRRLDEAAAGASPVAFEWSTAAPDANGAIAVTLTMRIASPRPLHAPAFQFAETDGAGQAIVAIWLATGSSAAPANPAAAWIEAAGAGAP